MKVVCVVFWYVCMQVICISEPYRRMEKTHASRMISGTGSEEHWCMVTLFFKLIARPMHFRVMVQKMQPSSARLSLASASCNRTQVIWLSHGIGVFWCLEGDVTKLFN